MMITDIEEFFVNGCGRCERFATNDCSARRWGDGLARLRRICLTTGMTETLKWGHPCYMQHERNIVILGAFRGDFRLSFFNAALMKDPAGVLEKSGPNAQSPDMIRFTDSSQVSKQRTIIESYLAEAIGYAEAGIKPVKSSQTLAIPDELLEALELDLQLAEAFYSLTPGRQKSYVINLNSAKKSETRIKRIAKFRDKILAGKGLMDR